MDPDAPWCVLLIGEETDGTAMRLRVDNLGKRLLVGDRIMKWDGTYTTRGEARYREQSTD